LPLLLRAAEGWPARVEVEVHLDPLSGWTSLESPALNEAVEDLLTGGGTARPFPAPRTPRAPAPEGEETHRAEDDA